MEQKLFSSVFLNKGKLFLQDEFFQRLKQESQFSCRSIGQQLFCFFSSYWKSQYPLSFFQTHLTDIPGTHLDVISNCIYVTEIAVFQMTKKIKSGKKVIKIICVVSRISNNTNTTSPRRQKSSCSDDLSSVDLPE